jgi:hypothetical protein
MDPHFVIAVLDTGILSSELPHVRLLPEVLINAHGGSNERQIKEHGTQIAATIATFAPEAWILPLNLTNQLGQLTTPVLEHALQFVLDHHRTQHINLVCAAFADFSNHQSDAKFQGTTTQELIAALRSQGVMVVAPAGNWFQDFEGMQGMGWPGILREVVSVGAWLESEDGTILAPYSQRLEKGGAGGCHTTLFEKPGPPGDTSGATAVVVGRLARLCIDHPNVDVEQLLEMLRDQSVFRG